jgi:hypothetical protein
MRLDIIVVLITLTYTVYYFMLDETKAFDRVRVGYGKLVRLLLDKKMPVVIIRILLNIYSFHYTSLT